MKTKLSKKRAISTVLTTVIILVSSVVLGSGVVLYGTSLFQGNTQTEAIQASDVKVWVHATDPTGVAWGAASVRNTGDKVISVNQISVRGTDIPFGQWYADTTMTSSEYQQALNHTGWVNALPGTNGPAISKLGACVGDANYLCIDQDSWGAGTNVISADVSTGPVSLDPGQTAVIYFKAYNGTFTSLDTGIQSNVSIYAGKAGAPYSIVVAGLS
ncbi:hypothetical protein C5F49_04400 [Nitrosopumilus oxyclinae]|uniref:Type IV pilin n=1 Tax=Nitrosopumilus oxyclinae TaxID=1959104 RepID=A0A7D5M2P7_9ARCH|nr:hypothetical protein [Nitrosopumilus oxyclinae]QLH04635.1 hypothetical protein C5F49_04400 [Nitrosopumilus oxyclinae]